MVLFAEQLWTNHGTICLKELRNNTTLWSKQPTSQPMVELSVSKTQVSVTNIQYLKITDIKND